MVTQTQGRIILAALGSWILIQSTGTGSQPADGKRQRDVEVSISMPETVFTGLPCIAEVRISNHTPKVAFPSTEELLALPEQERRRLFQQDILSRFEMPAYDLFSEQCPPISVEITDIARTLRQRTRQPGLLAFYFADWTSIHTPTGNPNPERYKRPRIKTQSGQSKSFLIDLEPWLNALPAGRYELTLYVYPEWKLEGGQSDPVPFRITEARVADWATMRKAIPALRKDKRKKPDRRDWLDPEINVRVLRDGLSDDVWKSLALYCFLGGSIKKDPEAASPLWVLKSLPDHLEVLADLLLYEYLLALGVEPAAEQIRQRVIETHPERAWQLDRAKEGAGLIQQAIQLTDPGAPKKQGNVEEPERPEVPDPRR